MTRAERNGRSGRRTAVLWVAVPLIAAVVAVTWWCTRPRPTPAPPFSEPAAPARLSLDGIEVDSPELAVGPGSVRATIHPDHSSWLVTVRCAEPDGCVAELAAIVELRPDGGRSAVRLDGFYDVSSGGEMSFDGLVEGGMALPEIIGLRIEVLHRGPLEESFGTDDIVL